VDVASTVVAESAGVARFRLVLSEPAQSDVSVDFTTRSDTGGATSGALVIPAGQREAVLEVSVDEGAGPAQRFTLELTEATGAQVRSGTATAVVAQTPVGAGEVELARTETEQTQLVIDLILENDWGSGALFNVVIKNVSNEPVSGWQLAMDLPFDLDELWSAVLIADEGERVTLGNAEWNGTIQPGEQVDFGFIAEIGNIALGQVLAGADLELAVQ
jgi:cellulase/cellobiase CelA1